MYMSPNQHQAPTLAVGITETWLKNYIADAQLSVPGYSIVRADRDSKIGGGCLLYVNAEIPITKQLTWSDRQTSLVTAFSEEHNLLLACVYRPPDAEDKSFGLAMTKLQEEINSVSEQNGAVPELILLGDFNLPNMNWKCTSFPDGGSRGNLAYHRTLEIINDNFLEQLVHTPTRGENILDIVLTNTPDYFARVETTESMISDHRVVECTLAYNPMETESLQKIEADPFRQFKVHNVDYLPMKLKLSDMDWDKLLEFCDQDDDGEEFKDGIVRVVLEVAEDTLSKKAKPRTTKPKKISEPFKRKARKIKKKLQLDLDPLEKKLLRNQLIDNDEDMKNEIRQNLDREEEKAVDTKNVNFKF